MEQEILNSISVMDICMYEDDATDTSSAILHPFCEDAHLIRNTEDISFMLQTRLMIKASGIFAM